MIFFDISKKSQLNPSNYFTKKSAENIHICVEIIRPLRLRFRMLIFPYCIPEANLKSDTNILLLLSSMKNDIIKTQTYCIALFLCSYR